MDFTDVQATLVYRHQRDVTCPNFCTTRYESTACCCFAGRGAGRGEAPTGAPASEAVDTAGATHPSDECGRRWLYSSRHCVLNIFASARHVNSSLSSNSSRTRP